MSSDHEFRYDPIGRELLYLHRVTTSNQGTFYHRHNAYEIYLFLRGNIHFYVENQCYRLRPGDLIILTPEEMHRSYNLDHSEYERITINLHKSYLNRLSTPATNLSHCFDYRPKGKSNIVHLDDERMRQFLDYTGMLEQLIHSGAYGADVSINATVSQLMVLINTVFQSTTFHADDIMPELVRKTMDYVEAHLQEDISLEQLSETFYLNSTYISRQFKKHTGLTLRSYMLDRRVELAKSCLSEGLSLSEACYQSGFADYSNFIRSFTKIAGISPGKYARITKGQPGEPH